MENQVRFPEGCEVVGVVNVFSDGSFRKDNYYVLGVHPELQGLGFVAFVDGYRGKETRVTRCHITPHHTFEVVPE